MSSELLTLLARHLASALHIAFVADEHFANVILRVFFDLLKPRSHVVEGLSVVDSVNYYDALSAYTE